VLADAPVTARELQEIQYLVSEGIGPCFGCDQLVVKHPSTLPCISVVIPTLNEAKNLPWVLERLPHRLHELIIVDGDSTDGTVETVMRLAPSARIIRQRHRGKGAALIEGLLAAEGDIAVMLDADGSMDPAEIPAMVGALLAGADVVKGSRAVPAGGSHDLSPLRQLGNRALTMAANVLYRQSWSELCYGYAAFWTDILPGLRLEELLDDAAASGVEPRRSRPYGHGFEIEALLFTRSVRASLRVAEVFSFEHPRRHGTSNLLTFRDGWRVLSAVLREQRFTDDSVVQRHQRAYPILPAIHESSPLCASSAA
jgi:glycosyltransferase involved in cell wall biosynthesis